MNFYLAALDDLDCEPGENRSIGIILCREHNRVVVQYAVRGVDAPIGVARYQLLEPDTLPTLCPARTSSPPVCCRISWIMPIQVRRLLIILAVVIDQTQTWAARSCGIRSARITGVYRSALQTTEDRWA
jgi:hypothetical protein